MDLAETEHYEDMGDQRQSGCLLIEQGGDDASDASDLFGGALFERAQSGFERTQGASSRGPFDRGRSQIVEGEAEGQGEAVHDEHRGHGDGHFDARQVLLGDPGAFRERALGQLRAGAGCFDACSKVFFEGFLALHEERAAR